ncbi:MAG: poly-gamma-glutamate synthase PgsB [Bacteroidales bacterium]|nr:poly-gamma-glutamate synthase PgsB [Bacteroidales bacterium]MCF8406020.1 poly-gamma-glutamate synthase PgsB [Bacteroidales bacterium]
MLIISIVVFSAILLLLIEKISIDRSLNKIQNRIHINGTRGKSSVTEYIAAGLGEEGRNTLAKITGITPTLIFNGKKEFIDRKAKARVQEQFKTMKFAAKKECHNFVLECMSVSPPLQQLESRIFKPHIYIITNIRDDHREEFGNNPEEQAEAICRAIPINTLVITNEDKYLEKIIHYAKKRGSRVESVESSLTEKLKSELPNGVYAENVALALTACNALNADATKAKHNIIEYISLNNNYLYLLDDRRNIHFLNGFAVNDIESSISFLKFWMDKIPSKKNITVIFNTRADRPLRTELFGNWLGTVPMVKRIILTGDHIQKGQKILKNSGIGTDTIEVYKTKKNSTFKNYILNEVEDHSLVFGVGNIAGMGLELLNELK